MGSGQQLAKQVREKILAFHKGGQGYKKIAKQLCIPVSTVKAFIQRYKRHGHAGVLPRSGRPSKMSAKAVRKVVREVKNNPRMSAKDLQRSLENSGVKVHVSTVKRTLNKHDLYGRKARRKPLLTPRHKKARLAYAKEHIDKNAAFWDKIMWSDETKVELFGHNQQRYVWRTKNTAHDEKNVVPTVKHGGGSLMFWGCMSSAGTGSLIRVDGRMNAAHYQEILRQGLLPSVKKLKMKRGWILQQDNDPKHTAKSTEEWFTKNKIKVLPWPAQSPDLNVIENLWLDLKKAVHLRKPTNLMQLEEICCEEWNKISKERIQRLLKGYPKRLQQVVKARGGHTSY